MSEVTLTCPCLLRIGVQEGRDIDPSTEDQLFLRTRLSLSINKSSSWRILAHHASWIAIVS